MSGNHHLRIAEIEINAAPTDERIVGIFRYESEQKNKRGPVLVLIAEIASTLYVYEQLLDVVNESLERLRPLVSGVDSDPMARFEKLVQGVNEAVGHFVAQEASPITWNRINMFLLEIQEEHLCLTGFGRLCNVFLQRQSDGNVRAFDIFGSLEQPTEVNPQKPFSGLIYGELKVGDTLFAGTQNFERLRQEISLVSRLKQAPPVTAALEIQQAIETQHIPDDFGAVILAQIDAPDTATMHPQTIQKEEPFKENSTRSVERMYAEEKTAEAILNPTMSPLGSGNISGDQTLQKQVQTFLREWKNLPRKFLALFTHASQTRTSVTLTGLRTMHAGHGSSFTRKHKRAILLASFILMACVGGTFTYRYIQQKNTEQAAWNAAYEEVLDKKNRAEASLVYGDEDRAIRLFQEAESLFQRLDERTEKRREGHQILAEALQNVRQKLRKEQRMDTPRLVFALSEESALANISTLTFTGNTLYTFDASKSEIITIEPTSKVVKRIPWNKTEPAILAIATKNNALVFTQTKKVVRADASKGTLASIEYDASQITTIRDAVVYGTRLYVLDPDQKMIWRHTIGASIGQASPYIKQTSEALDQATAIAIDSNVYVGFADGHLTRYLSGAQESWITSPIDPPVEHITSLWTNTETDRIVILDQKTKRLIVLRKDGKLVAQITSSVFQKPTHMTVDPTTKTIFVTDTKSLYAFDLP